MEIPHILEELAYDMGTLPRDAIESAVLKRTQMTPYLLEILQDAYSRIDEVILDESYQGHIYAMYLLAQFREQKAFPLILKLFSFPGEIPHLIAGDVLTEDLGRILASVCGNQIAPLKDCIESPLYNEYVRGACLIALTTLVGCGKISRKLVISYFKQLYSSLEKLPSFVWDTLVSCSCELYPEEVFGEIEESYLKSLVDSSFMPLDEVAQVLTEKKQAHLLRLHNTAELIEDTVSEIEKWHTPAESAVGYF